MTGVNIVSMSSRKTIGVAPLLTGILLASQSAQAIVQNGLSLWVVSGIIGGCAAILVGIGTLLEWDAFDQERSEGNPTPLAILGVAIVAVVAGATVALL